MVRCCEKSVLMAEDAIARLKAEETTLEKLSRAPPVSAVYGGGDGVLQSSRPPLKASPRAHIDGLIDRVDQPVTRTPPRIPMCAMHASGSSCEHA